IGDNFFRKPGTMDIWAEGTAAQGRSPWIESFALPDPNLYAARALTHSLQARGVAVLGGTASTTDSLDDRAARGCGAPLVAGPSPKSCFPSSTPARTGSQRCC